MSEGNSEFLIFTPVSSTTAGDVSVSISDIPCTVEDVDDTTILCRTGAKRPSVRTNVIVMIAGKGAASAVSDRLCRPLMLILCLLDCAYTGSK